MGYPGGVAQGEQPSWQGGISFHDDDEDGDAMELETDNGDATPGNSGGPFFAWWEGDGWPSLVGVVSAEEKEITFPLITGPEANNIAAAGSPMIDLVLWAQKNWAWSTPQFAFIYLRADAIATEMNVITDSTRVEHDFGVKSI